MSFEGTYQLMSTQKWTDWFLFMENNAWGNVRGWEGDPGPQGHWKFTKIGSTDKYLVSPKEWPNWYMYMDKGAIGNVRGCKGDPGAQGHWRITKKGTVIIGGKEVPTYVFTTEQWSDWYMYMDKDFTGNVRGWEGDPGIQGYFIMQDAPK